MPSMRSSRLRPIRSIVIWHGASRPQLRAISISSSGRGDLVLVAMVRIIFGPAPAEVQVAEPLVVHRPQHLGHPVVTGDLHLGALEGNSPQKVQNIVTCMP
jgi:hypothetical protein